MSLGSMPKQLIINADDGGINEESDDRLIELVCCGAITSISLLANGASIHSMVAKLKGLGSGCCPKIQPFGLGLHFNISEGQPLGGPYRTLCDRDGQFFHPKSEAWQRAADQVFDAQEIATEARLQWQALLDMDLHLDHVNGHNHIQIFAPVAEGLVDALGAEKIFFRIPEIPSKEPTSMPGFPGRALLGADLKVAIAKAPQVCNWQFPNRFLGFEFGQEPSMDSLSPLGEGHRSVTEWMVHPTPSPMSPFSREEKRSLEIECLCSDEAKSKLSAWGYELMSFGALL